MRTHYWVAGHDLQILTDVNNHHDCAFVCENNPDCKSIDYRPNDKECRLNDIEVTNVDDLEYQKFYKYYLSDCKSDSQRESNSESFFSFHPL